MGEAKATLQFCVCVCVFSITSCVHARNICRPLRHPPRLVPVVESFFRAMKYATVGHERADAPLLVLGLPHSKLFWLIIAVAFSASLTPTVVEICVHLPSSSMLGTTAQVVTYVFLFFG